MLSPRLLDELRAYWHQYRSQLWLFTGRDGSSPLAAGTAQTVFYRSKERARITHGHGIHSLRHSFATHLMEAGVELLIIQRLMGHTHPRTTALYLHVTSQYLGHIRSPLDLLRPPSAADQQPQTLADWMRALLDVEIHRCPQCGNQLRSQRLPPSRSPGPARHHHASAHRNLTVWDTS